MNINWWVVPGWIIGLAGLAFAIRNERKRRQERLHRQQRFEWEHVCQGVRQLCRCIGRDRFRPDFLLGIPGAGVILSELVIIEMGDRLPICMVQQKPIASSDPFDDGADGHEITTPKWRYWIPSDVLQQSSMRVLLLDDYAQSGDTLRGLRAALESAGFSKQNIRTAALISVRGLQEAGKAPDYTWFWVDTYDVHMPWGHASKKVRTGEATTG